MINLVNNIIRLLLLVVVSLLYTSCFTGVESTQKITEKDVKRAVERFDNNHEHSIRAYVDSLPSWREGKGFWVLDNQVRYLFTPSFDFDIDSLDLEGEMLTYAGYEIRRHIDNTEVVDVLLRYGSHVLRYATGKPIEDVSRSAFSIPFMVDDDMLKSVSQQLVGKTVYVKTPAWYDLAGNELSGCPHYVPVEILAVKPGNKLHPLRVEFRADNGNELAGFNFQVELLDQRHVRQIAERDVVERHGAPDGGQSAVFIRRLLRFVEQVVNALRARKRALKPVGKPRDIDDGLGE